MGNCGYTQKRNQEISLLLLNTNNTAILTRDEPRETNFSCLSSTLCDQADAF